jgi:serine/threonine protein kinase
MVGQTLSHFRIVEYLGGGGMGDVYLAEDVKLDRKVAIKVLPPELVSHAERKRRFIQEAKAAAKLAHPNIGVVHEIDEADGVTFIVMELIRGETLQDAIEKESLPLHRSLELTIEIAEGLSFAHEKGIVHRDLKPANIVLTERGHAKIIDFGLAKLVEPTAESHSAGRRRPLSRSFRSSQGRGAACPDGRRVGKAMAPHFPEGFHYHDTSGCRPILQGGRRGKR